MLTLIAARSRNGAIGKDNAIPWNTPEDLAFFQRETLGGALIMGRKTWDSLPIKPLKNRLNLVISSNPNIAEHVFSNIQDAADFAFTKGIRRIYGIGGQGIYTALLPHADRLLITEVDIEITNADAFFPNFSGKNWKLVGGQTLRPTAPACVLREYLKR
jgi:dihydrofolate reductase